MVLFPLLKKNFLLIDIIDKVAVIVMVKKRTDENSGIVGDELGLAVEIGTVFPRASVA